MLPCAGTMATPGLCGESPLLGTQVLDTWQVVVERERLEVR